MTRRSWWRMNRWWLLVLPVAVAVASLASAYRVKPFWYEDGLHHALATAEPGRPVRVVDGFRDTGGETTRTFDVELEALVPVEQVRSPTRDTVGVPPGVTAYQVRLAFSAAPDQELNFCHVALIDSEGNRYGGDVPDPLGQDNPCLPKGHEGPDPAILRGQQRGVVPPGHERPETWTVTPVVLVAKDVRITDALVWFDLPDYARLPAPR